MEIRLAKAIGLLQAIGYSAGIPASKDWLRFALKRAEGDSDKIDEAIRSLERRRVVVYRRHADSYALWEGSDVDIDERMQEARRRLLIRARRWSVTFRSTHPFGPWSPVGTPIARGLYVTSMSAMPTASTLITC